MNLESLRQFAILDHALSPLDSKGGTFDMASGEFGSLHNRSNGVNNPVIQPYCGEIPYSGRMITLGYYGNDMNNIIFETYGHYRGDPIYSDKLEVQ